MSLDNIIHYGVVRSRVNGSGTLTQSLVGLDSVLTATLPSIAMSASPGNEPTRLANFVVQKSMLRQGTTLINETFIINRVIVYVKPIWTQLPG